LRINAINLPLNDGQKVAERRVDTRSALEEGEAFDKAAIYRKRGKLSLKIQVQLDVGSLNRAQKGSTSNNGEKRLKEGGKNRKSAKKEITRKTYMSKYLRGG